MSHCAAAASFAAQFGHICRMIKIEHSVFALPYAWAGAFLATAGSGQALPSARALFFLTIAMVAVRSFAMTFNRLVDLPFDRANPRTQNRPLVTGQIGKGQAWGFCGIMAGIFVACCAALNSLCLWLAVPALVFAAVYSLLKRFTPLCHYWLGATLGLAPLAGWLAVKPGMPGMPVVLLFFGVTFWVAAFAHGMTSIFLLLAGFAAGLAWPWYVVWLGVSLLLLVEHKLMQPQDLRHVNTAFFTLNGIISPVVLAGVLLGMYF